MSETNGQVERIYGTKADWLMEWLEEIEKEKPIISYFALVECGEEGQKQMLSNVEWDLRAIASLIGELEIMKTQLSMQALQQDSQVVEK